MNSNKANYTTDTRYLNRNEYEHTQKKSVKLWIHITNEGAGKKRSERQAYLEPNESLLFVVFSNTQSDVYIKTVIRYVISYMNWLMGIQFMNILNDVPSLILSSNKAFEHWTLDEILLLLLYFQQSKASEHTFTTRIIHHPDHGTNSWMCDKSNNM